MNEVNFILDTLYKYDKYLGGDAAKNDVRSGNMSLFKKLGTDFYIKFK